MSGFSQSRVAPIHVSVVAGSVLLIKMLTIHVGLHKTGSTAIQRYLAQASKELGDGLVYLRARNERFSVGDGVDIPTSSEQWRSLTGKALATHREIVISHEGILGSPWGDSEIYLGAKERVEQISEAFTGLTDFQLVIYLRPQHQWLESVYTQAIQQGEVVSPQTFVAGSLEAKYLRYSRLIGDLTPILGVDRLIVRPYVAGGNVVEDFLKILDRPSHLGFVGSQSENVSISPGQVELLRRLNGIKGTLGKDRPGRRFFQDIDVGNRGGAFSVLPEYAQEYLIKLTEEDWQILGAAVEGTRFAEPAIFRDVADKAAKVAVRPHIGAPVHQGELIREATRALSVAIPMAVAYQESPNQPLEALIEQPPKKLLRSRLVHGIRTKLGMKPADPPATGLIDDRKKKRGLV